MLRGGCLTGSNHSGAELHGFLAYLARAVKEGRTYRIYGYKGKQVRDNIHSYDVCQFFMAFYEKPKLAQSTTWGAAGKTAFRSWKQSHLSKNCWGKLPRKYMDQNRVGDHICYISDLRRIKKDYPGWSLTRSLNDIFRELAGKPGDSYENSGSRLLRPSFFGSIKQSLGQTPPSSSASLFGLLSELLMATWIN